jgi:RNA polymerase sigma-70 factor, ECF subfamily
MTDRMWRERGLREAVLAGEESAWRVWLDEEFGPLESYVLWRCGQMRHLADDAVQETWIVAVKRLQRFDPAKGSFRNWLFGIASNVIRNLLKSHRRHATATLEVDPAGRPVGSGMRVAEALACLPERYEAALRMKYFEGNSVAEIAAEWNETAKGIESLLTRARQAFREAYGDDA